MRSIQPLRSLPLYRKKVSSLSIIALYLANIILLNTIYYDYGSPRTFSLYANALEAEDEETVEEPHPDPNDEDHPGMIYVGRKDDDGRRVGFDVDNGELVYLPVYPAFCIHLRCWISNS